MLSLPIPDGSMMSAIAWLYLITNATRIVTYVPQIVVVWRCTDGAFSVSLLTWGSWVLSQMTALFYGVLVINDLPFILISCINLLGCACVTGIVMHRRAQWKRKRSQAVVTNQTLTHEANSAVERRTRTRHSREAGPSAIGPPAQIPIRVNTS